MTKSKVRREWNNIALLLENCLRRRCWHFSYCRMKTSECIISCSKIHINAIRRAIKFSNHLYRVLHVFRLKSFPYRLEIHINSPQFLNCILRILMHFNYRMNRHWNHRVEIIYRFFSNQHKWILLIFLNMFLIINSLI